MMEPLSIRCHGCPTPVRESLAAALLAGDAGHLVHDADEVKASVELVYCDSPERWDQLRSLIEDRSLVVAMIARLAIDEYAHAVASGAAGVIHFDTSGQIMVSVIKSAVRGEIVMPAFAAQTLGAAWVDQPAPAAVSEYEVDLLESLSTGSRVSDVAVEFAYSERTIRRHLQSLYLKLGASGRSDAIRIASRTRLI